MRAALRLPDGEIRLPLGALLYALGLTGRGPAEVVGRLLGVDEGGLDRTFEVLELLQAVAKARHLLAHPLVLRIVALELVGDGSMPNPPSCSIGTRLLMGHRIGLVTALTAS